MFEAMSEQEARAAMLDLTREYYNTFHRDERPFAPGDRVSYASRTYDQDEMINLVDSALEFWLTSGRYTDEFERRLGEYLDVPYCSLVNSGSSANLLAFMALTQPELGDRRIKRGDEVITVACGFPTTVAPIIQYGAIPVFCDVAIPQYNIEVESLQTALSPKTKAVMLAHTLGNPFNISAVKDFCNANGLWLIEDNCDALGSRYTLDGVSQLTGSFGDIGTSSFYPPHHMTMGEGGAVYTSNHLLHRIIRSLRDWGRDCICPPGMDNCCGHRFDMQLGELPKGYDHKYTYSRFGYNLKATDMQAAIGCAQLDKLPSFVENRKHNFERLHRKLASIADKVILPQAEQNSDPSWFGFLMTCQKGVDRNKAVSFIESKNIQTRALFAGNMLRHPCFDSMRARPSDHYRTIGKLEATDRILQDSFWVGVNPGMTDNKIDWMAENICYAIDSACA